MLNNKPMFDKKGVFWFLGLTFGMTYLIGLGIYLRGGLTSPGWYTLLQAGCRAGTVVLYLLPAVHR